MQEYFIFVLNSSVFWDITPCSPLKVNRRFGETFAFIFRVEELAKHESSLKQVANRD
jgi:hypothetical protein